MRPDVPDTPPDQPPRISMDKAPVGKPSMDELSMGKLSMGEAPTGDESSTAADVGAFDQGSQFSRWALGRYIVGRVILERTSWTLFGIAFVLFLLAGASEWLLHSTALAVLLVILMLTVLLLRLVLRAVLRRLMAFSTYGPVEDRVRTIVNDSSRDIFAELGRVGLPSHTFTLPLLVPRLIGRRRSDTMTRIRSFEVERAVTRAHRDELYLVLRDVTARRR